MKRLLLRYFLLPLAALLLLGALLFGRFDLPLDVLQARYAPPPSAFVEVDGMHVHYREEGPAADTLPLLLLHGTGASLHTWDGWVGALIDSHRVVRLDLPGFGLTGPFPDRRYTLDAYADFVYHFMEKTGIRQAIVGGNSLGGGIAWNLALRHPEAVHKLILVDAVGYPPNPAGKPLAFQLAKIPLIKHTLTLITPRSIVAKSLRDSYGNPERVSDTLVQRYFDLALRPGNRQAFVDRMNLLEEGDESAQIRRVAHPTLLLWGAKDKIFPLENARRFHDDLPNDTLIVFPELGHVPMEEDGATTAEAVRFFLQ